MNNPGMLFQTQSDRRPKYKFAEKTQILQVEGRDVPLATWIPAVQAPCPLVLVGHGGAGHKRSDVVLDLVKRLVEANGIAVAAIDGPVHGDRRKDLASPDVVRDEFRALWENGGSVDSMRSDWLSVLNALCELPEIDEDAVGYYGLSMGTAYGLPFLSDAPGIKTAILGMWGTSRSHGDRLLADAKNTHAKTMFCMQWHDELFTREGQFELFDALAANEKSVAIHPGKHTSPTGDRLDDITHYLVRELTHGRAR